LEKKKETKSQMNVFERLIQSIPGFKGYFQKELRRDSDQLQREFMVEKMSRVKDQIQDLIKSVAREKRLDLLTDYDEVMRGLEKFANEVRYADRGYSGFFDLVKISRDQLDEIYQFDFDMVERVFEFMETFKKLSANPLDKTELRFLKKKLDHMELNFRERNDILKGFSPMMIGEKESD
jgi:hypothetical protein